MPLVPCLSMAQVACVNPSLALGEVDSTRSAVSVAYDASSGLAEMVEEGTGWHGVTAEGRTVMRLSPTLAAWGLAAYDRGVRKDVQMSESADIREVGPMAVADTIGGDKKSEGYRFRVGFAWQGRRASVGLDIKYSSLSEFRTRDPRPKADAVTAAVRLGGALNIADGQTIGLFGTLRKYSQEMDVDFKNTQKGTATIYHLTGLGSDYSRFAGSNDEVAYDGRRVGGGVSYTGPLCALVELSRRHTEKLLPDLANILISETYDNCLVANIARHGALNTWTSTLALDAKLNNLTLKTSIYDDGTRNYRLLSTREPYERRTASAALTAQMSRPRIISLSVSVAYNTDRQENTELARRVETSDVGVNALAEAWHEGRVASLSCGVGVALRRNVKGECELGARRSSESAAAHDVVRRDFELRSANVLGGEVSGRADFRIAGRGWSPFVGFNVGGLCRSGGADDAWHASVSVGVGF